MAASATETTGAERKAAWGRDLLAGLSAGCVMLPLGLSAGVLVYAPLGADYVAQGAAAGLLTAIVAGGIAAALSSSSFIITGALASTSIIPAALTAYLTNDPGFAAEPSLIVFAIGLCVLLGGLLQIVFGALNLGSIIKYTPHSVIAGFINSIGLLIILSQLRSYLRLDLHALGFLRIERPVMFAFVMTLALVIIAFRRWKGAHWAQKLPAPLFGLLVGTVAFYGLHRLFPDLPLGRTIGKLPLALPSLTASGAFPDASGRRLLLGVADHLLLVSLTIAAVATLQSLLAFRVAQNLADLSPRPPRDLVAHGIANCVSALCGGIVGVGATAGLKASFGAGGQTRLAGISCALIMFLIASVFSSVLAAIPVTVLSAILVAIGFEVFDRWTFKLPIRALRRQPGIDRRHAWQNLCVVALVMVVSATATIVTGAIAGFALSCLIFIVNMTRPIVRRRYSGDEIFSKRRRSSSDMEVLLRTARERVVLELQGALFFGNADELAHLVSNALKESRMILLDLRAISEIDVSGAAILANLAARLQRQGRTVLFCGLATDRLAEASFAAPGAVFSDLDSGLEWMEEESLRAVGVRVAGMAIPMAELDLVRDLDGGERSSLERLLTRRDFAPGATICREGEAADRMWVLTKGTVSVKVESESGPHRIASLAAGTTVGEMALLEAGLRSATVTADEEVSSYELGRDAFDIILRDHPRIAQKLLSYFAREMARRLRLSDRDLRAVSG